MNFLLNFADHFSMQHIALLVIQSICGFAIAVSFVFSKNFVNAELNKLKTNNKLDKIIILASGMILTAITVATIIVATNISLEHLGHNEFKICKTYYKLVAIFSISMITTYMVSAPYHPHLRFLNISDKEALSIYHKILRIVIVTCFIALIASFAELALKHFLSCLTVAYYFLEIMISRKIISKAIESKMMKSDSFSFKLIQYVNEKLVFLLLIGMLSVFFIKYPPEEFFSESLINIWKVTTTMFVAQILISKLVNWFIDKLDSIKQGLHSKSSANKRQKNLIWICDVIVIMIYLSIACTFLTCVGIDIGRRIFNDKIISVAGIIFVTAVIYKGFNEIADALLERSQRDTGYKTKLETFLPTLSITFYVALFCTSALSILSHLGFHIGPILATFTVFSAAVGLASQDIIKSFLHGLTFLIEKNLYVGAYVKINEMEGTVEKLSARVLYLRKIDGVLVVVPYDLVHTIMNYSQDYSCYYGALYINVGDDVDKISQILRDIVSNMKNEEKYRNRILGEVDIYGLKPFDLEEPSIFWRLKTTSDVEGLYAKYEIYRRLYIEYQKRGIKVPISQFPRI